MIGERDLRLFHHADELVSVGLFEKTAPLGEGAHQAPAWLRPLQTRCSISQLEINVAVNSTKRALKTEAVSLDCQRVETVENFKWCISLQSWTPRWALRNIQSIFSKDADSDFIFFRKLSGSQQILDTGAPKYFVQRALTFHLPAWCGHLNCRSKRKLSGFLSMASKIVGKPQKPSTQLFYRGRGRRRGCLGIELPCSLEPVWSFELQEALWSFSKTAFSPLLQILIFLTVTDETQVTGCFSCVMRPCLFLLLFLVFGRRKNEQIFSIEIYSVQ